MTEQEKKAQQERNQAIINTGRGAYRMLIHISGNPHSKQPARDLWEKGWRLERRKEEGFRPQPPRQQQAPPTTTDKPAPKPPRHGKPFQKRPAPKPQAPPPQPPTGPVITDRLINRFNRRHQTQA